MKKMEYKQTMKLKKESYPPVYLPSLAYALEHGEVNDFIESRKHNFDCKEAIKRAISESENYDGIHLDRNMAVPILETYGTERVTFILANTVQQIIVDEHFSNVNKAWAESIGIPQNVIKGIDLNADYVVDSNPTALDRFIGQARQEMQKQFMQQEERELVSEESKELAVEGHFGTWHTVEAQEIQGEMLYLMEHDEYGNLVAGIIVNANGELVAEDLEQGFDEEAMEAIYEYFADKVQKNNVSQTTLPKMSFISDRTKPEVSLHGISPAEIEETVLCYVQAQIDERNLSDEVKLLGVRVYGSRTRKWIYTENSDIDVAISYSGGIREDEFFDKMNEEGLQIAGLQVDMNPISLEKSGTLEEYLNYVEKYLDRKETQMLTEEIVTFSRKYGEELLEFWEAGAGIENEPEQAQKIIYHAIAAKETKQYVKHLESLIAEHKEDEPIVKDAAELLGKITGKMVVILPDPDITFYVAACMDSPVLGEYHENLTFQEAVELYQKIPKERTNGRKGIGFRLEDGSSYHERCELMAGGIIQKDFINNISHFTKSPLVQKAIADMESILSEWENVKKEQDNISTDKDWIEGEDSELQKDDPEVLSKKESVLNALRERKAKLKTQKHSKLVENPEQQKKGEAVR